MHKSVLVLPLILLLGGCNTLESKFRRADLNGDHKLSKREFTDGVVEIVFAKYDTNKDGVVTLAEWEVVEGKANGAGFKARDVNHDGKITKAEAKKVASKSQRFADLFVAIDANHDGYIEVAEVEAYKKAHPKPQN